MVSFEKGAIVRFSPAFEEAAYDIGSEKAAVVTDGKGGLLSYKVNDRQQNFVEPFFALTLIVNGQTIDPASEKTVKMIGRMQQVTFQAGEEEITVVTFMEKCVNGAFFRIFSKSGKAFSATFDLRAAKTMPTKTGVTYFEEGDLCLSSDAPMDWIGENESFYAVVKGELRLLLSFGEAPAVHKAAFASFDKAERAVKEEIEAVTVPAALSEEEKAFYNTSHFAALENFKSSGAFRAFAAGSNYTYPLRTYFRDSYFTVLSMLFSHPDLVRNEILTLARSIEKDGTCPSAVKSDGTAFWGNHFDSPSLFVMELFDYITATGDDGILLEKAAEGTVLEEVKRVLDKLSDSCDQTGLIYKQGLNRRDWADEVNRGGYVTYVEALFARALYCASVLYKGRDDALSASYKARFEKVKEAINTLLFDPEKGYYVNFKTNDFTEDNLSIDTVFTVLFGIADGDKAKRVLDNMERLLESGNNKAQSGGDFGAMCVYPPYSGVGEAVHKSARPFDYHNGANWPFLTAMYAYAKALFGREWREVLLAPFRYAVNNGIYTAVEYFSPFCKAGSRLQAWSSAVAFVYDRAQKEKFFK